MDPISYSVPYSIQAVAKRTGLTPHVIRVWERRYSAVAPVRTGTNRRQYTDQEVERLILLRRAIGEGHRIGNIARLSTEQLRQLASEWTVDDSLPAGSDADAGGEGGPDRYVQRSLEAVQGLDAAGLEEVLRAGLVAFGHQGLLCRVVAPMVERLGERWREGVLTAAHEHFATALLRVFLFHAARSYAPGESGPCLIVATPTGQLHELGAVMIASAAMNLGWRVAYLGASLPAAEIAGAVRQKRGRVVALSIVYPADDTGLPAELIRLREFLPPDVPIIVGGRAASAYADALGQIGALRIDELSQFTASLDRLRPDLGTDRARPV